MTIYAISGGAETTRFRLCLLMVTHRPAQLEREVGKGRERRQGASIRISRGAFHIARLPHLLFRRLEQSSGPRSCGFSPPAHLRAAWWWGDLLPSPRVHSDQCHTSWCRSVESLFWQNRRMQKCGNAVCPDLFIATLSHRHQSSECKSLEMRSVQIFYCNSSQVLGAVLPCLSVLLLAFSSLHPGLHLIFLSTHILSYYTCTFQPQVRVPDWHPGRRCR